MKVLHVVNSTLDTVVAGYTIRTREIVRHQKAAGLEVAVVSADFGRRRPLPERSRWLDGVPHHFCSYPSRPWQTETIRDAAHAFGLQLSARTPGERAREIKLSLLFEWFVEQLRTVVARERPDVLHAHSPHPCARAALKMGLPVVYEVRGLWEESAVAEGRYARNSRRFRFDRTREIEACRGATAVLALNRALADELSGWGVRVEGLAPNCVDADDLAPGPKDEALAAQLGLDGPVLGYVGSLRPIEGVDFAIAALPRIRARCPGTKLLVVGDGPEKSKLEATAKRLGLDGAVRFTGRVPHERVQDYYRLIDVFVVTRPDLAVTRLVTPLKPLEAMACGLPVVVPDLPALREIVTDARGRTYPPGDVEGFTTSVEALLGEVNTRAELGAAARGWILEERTWSVLIRRYETIYEAVRR